MSSRIYVGTLMHERCGSVTNRFRYPVYLYGFDLDDLPALDRGVTGFGYNRIRPVAIHDRDYLERGPERLRDKLGRILERSGVEDALSRVELVTAARYLNYVFNPVSFYYCYGESGPLRCIVAEVNNTFGERHVYVLDQLTTDEDGYCSQRDIAKAFHVSPFYDVEGEYHFRFADLGERLDVRIDVSRDGAPAFRAHLIGQSRPLTGRSLAHTIARYPLTAALTMPRIAAQAARLKLGKGVPAHEKPTSRSTWTIRTPPPSRLQRIAAKFVMRAFEHLPAGMVDIRPPCGFSPAPRLTAAEPYASRTDAALVLKADRPAEGGSASVAPAILEVRHPAFFTRVVSGGNVGLGESYERGEWESPELTRLLTLLAMNRKRLEEGAGVAAKIVRPFERLWHAVHANTRRGSRRNIEAHYDLGNEFFQLFLDPSMTYSSARFEGSGMPLQEAQHNKLDLILDKSRATSGSRVLEIGSGWGSFALRAAQRTGVRVHGITLSNEQLEFARARVAAAGLSDCATFDLLDYRDVQGTFDSVVSIEMLEAVGHRHLGSFFEVCDRSLARGGKVVLQVITIADQHYDTYRSRLDWVQKYVFPGGHLPSIGALTKAMTRHSSLFIEDLESFGPDYASTLRVWRERFERRWEDARALGYPESFLRRWRYYLCCCEAGFETGEITVTQMVLGRPATASVKP